MKKLVLSLIMGAMLATNVVAASAATTKHENTKSGVSIVSVSDSTIFHPQTTDPDGW
jgi:hypothetical protein